MHKDFFHACFCLSISFIIVLNILLCEVKSHQQVIKVSHTDKQVMFYPLGRYVDIDVNVIPTYFYEATYFRGYFEVHYHDDDFDWSGRQRFSSASVPEMDNVPVVVADHELTCQYALSWELLGNMSAPILSKKQTLTIKFFPTFNLNVDPYSVRAYMIEEGQDPTIFEFTPLFPNSDNQNSTLGPWEFTVSISDYFNEEYYVSKQIVFFAYSQKVEKLLSKVPIRYPRVVAFNLEQYELSILYPNATVLDPSQTMAPSVMVSKYGNHLIVPESYELIDAFIIEEDSTFQMEDIRTFDNLENELIWKFSLACAYATIDSNFQNLSIDPTSSFHAKSSLLSCHQSISESKYVMALIGKPFSSCTFGSFCKVSPEEKSIQYSTNPSFEISFKPDTQLLGHFVLNEIKGENYKNVKHTPTSQNGISLMFSYVIDFSSSHINAEVNKTYNSQNEITVSVEIDPRSFDRQVDPFSIRLFKLNSEGDFFELISDDTPRYSQSSFSLDLEPFIKPNTPNQFIFGLFSFTKSDAVIGEIVYAHYPREVSFSLENHVNLQIYFESRYSFEILYESRPYFTINNYTPSHVNGIEGYEVLYSFLQQNGNGLETLGFDEGRKFTIDFDANIFKKIKFTDLKGYYLFKESNFQTLEESSAKVVLIPNSKQLVIDFQEDIRDETFAFILVGKPFVPNVYLKEMNSFNALIPTDMDRFNSQELPMDTLTVSFNPNSRSHGNYILKVDQRKYSDYSLPKTQLQPLTLVGSYIIDTSNISTFSNLAIDTQLDLIYEKNSINRNLDPFSYRFFSVDDENQAFNWLECDDSQTNNPWKLSIDIAIFPKLKFAVFVYNNAIGEFGKQYSIHYERSLNYELSKNNNFELVFSSKSFPQLNNGATFILNEKSDSSKLLEGYVKVKSFSIIQTVKSDISTDRLFSYDTKMQDENGNKISDLDSLQCVYITSERILYGSSSITKTDSIYTLQCPETILQEEYSLVIIAKSSKPINPQTSTNTDRNNDGEHVTVVALGLCVGFMGLFVIVLIVIVIVLLVRKKNPIAKEKIFNFGEQEGYNSFEL